MTGLTAWGWDADHAAGFGRQVELGHEPGRIVVEDRGSYLCRVATGEVRATLSGRFRWDAELAEGSAFPAVGDWVLLEATGDPGHRLVQGILPRRTAVVRRAPADRAIRDQVLAANVDVLLIVSSLNGELNRRRLERYLAVAWSSGAQPVIVLNKADLAEDVDAALAEVQPIAGGVPIHVVSAATGLGLAGLAGRLEPARTVALIGSSGVGKSTLVNALAGETIAIVGDIRDDDARGRHTTSNRHLALLPGGAIVLDTPGLRELGVVDTDGGLDQAFSDVDELAAACRFRDCGHDAEPGCEVQAAIDDGRLDAGRLAGRRKLDRELARAERERNPRARAHERRKWRLISGSVRDHMRLKYGDEGW